jgi:hypothetical protein
MAAFRDTDRKVGLVFEGEDKGLSGFGIRDRGQNVRTDQTEESMLHVLEQIVAMTGQVRVLPETPDELEVQVGLKLDISSGGFIITRGQNDANFVVTMKCRRDRG